MDYTQILGLVAGGLTTVAFLPQVIKTWRSQSARDLSLVMFFVFALGTLLWLIYGIIIKQLPIILANSITLALASVLLYFKLRFKDQ
jgi:MtN3 and saliva related transmembrane protein